MSSFTAGLLLTFLFHLVFLALLVAVVLFLPKSFLGRPAKAVLRWLPPFLGGNALRDWAATVAEGMARKRLNEGRTGETASLIAMETEEAAMHAMLPLVDASDLDRIVACPEAGQGRIGVTAPEALEIAAFIRKQKRSPRGWPVTQPRTPALCKARGMSVVSSPTGHCVAGPSTRSLSPRTSVIEPTRLPLHRPVLHKTTNDLWPKGWRSE
jgi:hypothetical protein